MSVLYLVPAEILTRIAVFLACHDPYSPPNDLLTLQATHPDLNLSLNCHINPALWAAAFRFRFDHLAVLRRNFRPNGRDYYDQLRQYTETLAAVRRRDADLDEEAIRTIYVMLLDNNGKNRSQLERAGVDEFLYLHLRTRLNAESHDGWPIESAENAYVLWALWLLTTPGKLAEETTADREQTVALLLPYVLNPYRYCQAETPPCHFACPLPSLRPAFSISMPSAHGPYPVYADPGRLVALPYFGSMPAFAPPPVTPAAKLLYFARRETVPFSIPPHLPRTRAEAPASTEPHPVQEDFIEVNAHRGAAPPPSVTWDWAEGCKRVNGIRDDALTDHSILWDPDYWRRRLCGNAWLQSPKWRPGRVYEPGCMDGLWQGRLALPPEAVMRRLISHAACPPNFTEDALHLTHQPLFMRLKELHAMTGHVPFPLDTWSDLSMRNAWFPGPLGNLHFDTDPGHSQNILVKLDGHASWPYKLFDRRSDHRTTADDVSMHDGSDHCQTCREREDAIKNAKALDDRDHESIMDAYARDWRSIDRLFESVGLGSGSSDSDSDDPMDDDDHGAEPEDDITVDEEESPEFLQDVNAQVVCPRTRPVRRGTDRAKIPLCNGIKDIIFKGTTDRRHALAWNAYTSYGRVRPWDGLIGILRRSFWPRQNFIFFYGYLVGSETFVGNWRFAALDPSLPTWESAFVMSRRKDDDDAHETG